jgi:cytochrome P450
MFRLGNNPDEWIEPEKFIPDRFNPSSPYFLTPRGTSRNPFSFSPFLGGQRICIGKTFIEAVSKFTVPSLLYHFQMEFTDDVDPKTFTLPFNNMIMTHMVKTDLLLSEVHRQVKHSI